MMVLQHLYINAVVAKYGDNYTKNKILTKNCGAYAADFIFCTGKTVF